MSTVEDQRLLAMAGDPPREVFPILRRSAEMRPLVVLLAVLPGLIAIDLYDVNDIGAEWGIASLEVFADGDEELQSRTLPTATYDHVPPLGLFVTACSQWLIGAARPVSLVLPSYLATVLLIGAVYLLGVLSGNHRVAFLTAVLAGLHPHLVSVAQQPGPYALSVLLASLSLISWHYHRLREKTTSSWYLAAAGVSLGLCLLAGGPLVIVTFLTMVLYAAFDRPLQAEQDHHAHERITRHRHPHTLQATGYQLLIIFLTAFGVGGWWLMMMEARHPAEFWGLWFWHAPAPSVFQQPTPGFFESLGQILAFIGVIFGLAVLGTLQALRQIASRAKGVSWLRLLLVWATLGLCMWVSSYLTGYSSSGAVGMYRVFAMIPLICLAAMGFEAIRLREATCFETGTVAILSLATGLLASANWLPEPFRTSAVANRFGLVTFLVLVVCGWLVSRDPQARELRRRWVIGSLLVCLVLIHAGTGWAAVSKMGYENRDFDALRQRLANMDDVESCTLISYLPPPARLVYLLRSLWPNAEVHVVQRWSELPPAAVASPTDSDEVKRIVMSWGERGGAAPNARRLGIQPIRLFATQYVEGRLLETFHLKRVPQ